MDKVEPKITIVTKKNGKKYAYRAVGHTWDPEKKQCRTKIEYYGTVDENGNIIPKRQKLVKADVVEREDKERKVSLTMLDEKRIGMVRVLWQILSRKCFPGHGRQYFLLLSSMYLQAGMRLICLRGGRRIMKRL